MRAWTFQIKRDVEKLGAKKAPWYTGWIDPETGKRRSKKMGTKTSASGYARKLEGEDAAGTYRPDNHGRGKTWEEFIKKYRDTVLPSKGAAMRSSTEIALNAFERLCEPHKMKAIKTAMIDEFFSKRRLEVVRRTGNLVSVATVNKEARHLRAVLNIAADWGYLAAAPRFRMIKEPTKLPRYVTEEHFKAIYAACDAATRPSLDGQEYSPGDWWRALTTFLYLTGWRIGETLALRWDDVSLDAGTVLTRAETNKGGRDEVAPLHPLAVDHLRTIISFGGLVFEWDGSDRAIWDEFGRIQTAAEINLPCSRDHQHTPRCKRYGFHDLRRSYGTRNAKLLPAPDLMRLMRHKSFSTTLKYINAAHELEKSVAKIDTPEFLKPEPAQDSAEL